MSKDSRGIHQDLMDLAFYFSNSCCQNGSCDEFSLLEFKALCHIQQHPDCPVQSIGQTLDITKSGATRLVNRLIKRELIERTPCQKDARIRLLQISPAGQQCLDAVHQFQDQRMNALLQRVQGVESEDVRRVLRALASAI